MVVFDIRYLPWELDGSDEHLKDFKSLEAYLEDKFQQKVLMVDGSRIGRENSKYNGTTVI